MEIQIKPMKLVFTRTDTHWNKQIVELENPSNILLDITYQIFDEPTQEEFCLLYTSPSPRDRQKSRMPSSA